MFLGCGLLDEVLMICSSPAHLLFFMSVMSILVDGLHCLQAWSSAGWGQVNSNRLTAIDDASSAKSIWKVSFDQPGLAQITCSQTGYNVEGASNRLHRASRAQVC